MRLSQAIKLCHCRCVSDACDMLKVLLHEHDALLGMPASKAYPPWFQGAQETSAATDGVLSGRGHPAPTLTSSGICALFHVNIALQQSLLQRFYNEVTVIIPKLDDYACAVCSDIAWRPIRLDCSHVFCCRCVSRLHHRRDAAGELNRALIACSRPTSASVVGKASETRRVSMPTLQGSRRYPGWR